MGNVRVVFSLPILLIQQAAKPGATEPVRTGSTTHAVTGKVSK